MAAQCAPPDRSGRPVVFLDRDGTLNRAFVLEGVSHPPSSVNDLEVLPGVSEALARLKRAGFTLVVITNQPDVARGTLPRKTAEQINTALLERLQVLDALECCFHDDGDRCDCRKPQPGMLQHATQQLGLDLSRSFVVGDSWRDTEAGQRAGCTSIQIRSSVEQVPHRVAPEYWAADVLEASTLILKLAGRYSSD